MTHFPLLACVETLHETFAMRSRHIVKYLILTLVFSSCLAYAQVIWPSLTAPVSPSMLIPKCKFI